MQSLALVQRSALPDGAPYGDRGCHLHPSCLTCPFATCLKHTHSARTVVAAQARARDVQSLRSQGRKVREIMTALQLSRRTVYRLLRYSTTRG